MYLPILDLRMVTLITDADDQLLAVGISMPSLAEALQKAHGRLLPMGWYHLAKTIFLKKYPKMLDLLLVAVNRNIRTRASMHCCSPTLSPSISNLVSSMPKVIRSWN